MIALLAAVAANGVIGRAGGLPWRLPGDLANFRRITLGRPMVMGRRTFASIGRPLDGRVNIVLSRDPGFRPAGVTTACGIDAALALGRREAGEGGEVMVIGGGEIYRQTVAATGRNHLTRVHAECEGDTRLPDLDKPAWRDTVRERRFENGTGYSFTVQHRRHPGIASPRKADS